MLIRVTIVGQQKNQKIKTDSVTIMTEAGVNYYRKRGWICILLLSFFFSNCTSKKQQQPLFEVLDSKKTGLTFTNHLLSTDSLNLFKYMYFYNGAGVGAGDFNNDGLVDLFFSSNQANNTLYLNTGKLHFKDVSAEAGIPRENAWSTGVSVVDINN